VREDRLDGVHRAAHLILDVVGMSVLGQHVWMLVVERRGRCAGDEEEIAGREHADRRRVGHVGVALGLGLDLGNAGVGGRDLERRRMLCHGVGLLAILVRNAAASGLQLEACNRLQ